MKVTPYTVVGLLLFLLASTSHAQDTGHLYGTDSQPNTPSVSGGLEEALKKAITNVTYTWEHETGSNMEIIVFLPGGKGKETFFNLSWRVKSPHDVEMSIVTVPQIGSIVLHFSDDYLNFTATDFNGSKLHGHKINW